MQVQLIEIERIDHKLSTYFFLQMTTLLHGNGIWLLGEYLAHLRQITILRHFILYLGRIMNKGKLCIFTLYHLKKYRLLHLHQVFAHDSGLKEKRESLYRKFSLFPFVLSFLSFCFLFFYLLETFLGCLYRTDLSNGLQNVTILFFYWIVPDTIFYLIAGTI